MIQFVKNREIYEQENRPLGSVENRIVIRFWILSLLFALLGVAALKLR